MEPVGFTPLSGWCLPPSAGVRGRLAPSPTGFLHLGNAWAFLLAWLSARARGGELVLRLEDIDPQRSRPEYVAALLDDLRWLGLDWDYGPGGLRGDAVPWPSSTEGSGAWAPGAEGAFFYQSQRTPVYAAALAALEAAGASYPCFCTRKELRLLAGAPHVDDRGAPYPGTCRHLTPEERAARLAAGRRPCVRLRCPDGLWLPCVVPTALSPISWQPRWMTASWALPKSCAGATSCRQRRASWPCCVCWACLRRGTPISRCCWTATANASPSGIRA